MTNRVIAITALLSAAAVFGAVMVETVQVQRAAVTLREGKGRAMPKTAEVTRGQTVEVLERSGNWLKLKSGENVGWAHQNDLVARKSGDTKGDLSLTNLGAGELEDAGAAKGVTEDAKVYAKSTGASTDPLDALISRRETIANSGEWLTFAKEGKVGVH